VLTLPRPRVAIVAGPAFTFGYAEHPELLTAAGAEVVTFDPLRDEQLPDDVDGLVIGDGFPCSTWHGRSTGTRCAACSTPVP
jgi:cobyrinic acid a,c-diamide synthase